MPRMPTYEELENRITELEEEVANNRLIEEELIRSEEKYKALFEGVSEGILVADIGTKEFKYANPAICKMLGYSEEELKQLSVYDIHPKEVLDYLISQFEDQARGENTLATNIPCVARDRSIIYADIGTAKVLIDGHEYNIGLFTDITERKRAEEALRRSQQEFRLIAENVPGLFSYLNSNGRYRFVNKNYEEWFNLPSTEIIGKHYREVLGVTTYDVIKDRVKAALSGQRVCYEDALPYKHGGTRWVFVEYVPDIDDGGKVKGFYSLVTDITNRKHMEEALKENERALERQAQSLQELNTTLNVLLDRREQEKKEFEENILENVQDLIFPYVEKLEEGKLDDRNRMFLSIIRSNLEDLISPFIRTLSSKYSDFTPKESQIAVFVKQGKTSKEIASLLDVSSKAIDFHRNNIRAKLGLHDKKVNLRSFLASVNE